jgi:cytochrome c-type biogenesis protein CcmE
MKISHIFAIVLIALAIGIIISVSGDASTYVNFKEAFKMASEGNDDDVHVVGKLKKDGNGNIVGMVYEPLKDPNLFTFIIQDENNEEHKVIYFKPKPPDLERSEKIVIIGHVKNNVFVAENILLKCPSKYEEKEVKASI